MSTNRRIEIDGRTGGLTFAYAHLIPGHPKCGRLHGHDGAVILRAEGPVNPETGMVVDFGILKTAARDIIKTIDHYTLLPAKDTVVVKPLSDRRVNAEVVFAPNVEPYKEYRFPVEDVYRLPEVNHSSAEELADLFADLLDDTLSECRTIGDHDCSEWKDLEGIRVGWCEGPSNVSWSQWVKLDGR